MVHGRFDVANDDARLAYVPKQSAHCDARLFLHHDPSIALSHHFGGELLKEIKGALKVLSVTADHAMLQPTLLKVTDIVNYRLGTSREHKSTAIATLLLGSDAAVDGENRARNLVRITASPSPLGTHFC